MPVAVAVVARYIIMAIIQAGLWWLVEKTVIPLLNKVIVEVSQAFGVDEETAEDIVANELLVFAEQVGVFAFAMKSKMPIKIAERLGFTTKGFSKRLLPETLLSKFPSLAKKPPVGTAATAAHVQEIAKATAVAKGLSLSRINDVVSLVTKIVAVPVGSLFMIAQWIDFGNWNSGAYQKTMQGVLAKFGLHPDSKIPQSSVLSKDVWLKVFNTYREQGAISINDPFKNEVVAFTRENLIDVVDKIASSILLEGGSASVKNVIGATTALITFKSGGGSTQTGGISTQTGAGTAGSSLGGTASTGVKVFTGILSSGKLGDGLEFVARQDDLIENIGELQQAVNNNAAPFVSSLLGRLIYEVKIVSSVLVGGIRKYGTSQTIQVGQTKSGAAKMKTITNRFAIMDLYLGKEDGGRTKLKSIVLGPTNALSFQPTTADLTGLSARISQDLITSNTDEIYIVATNTPTSVVAPSTNIAGGTGTAGAGQQQAPAVPQEPQYSPVSIDIGGRALTVPGKIFKELVDMVRESKMDSDNAAKVLGTYTNEAAAAYWGFKAAIEQATGLPFPVDTGFRYGSIPKYTEAQRESEPTQTSSAGATSIATQEPMRLVLPAAALSASTLSQFYSAMGWAWQSVAERAIKYQELGLGQAAFYVGTAEQNTRLLNKLKSG